MREDDIRDVMAEEKGRGRRHPKDALARKQERELLRRFREALSLDDENDFIEAIRELGLGEDAQKLQKALRIWRASRRA